MPDRVVLDASAALAILRIEPSAAEVGRRMATFAGEDDAILVPDSFWLELANVLVRRHGWTTDAVVAAFEALDELGVATVTVDRPLALLGLDLMAAHRLTAYDAAYLALAEVEDAALLTLDADLAVAAGDRSVVRGERRTSERREAYGASTRRPAWTIHAPYLAELRRRATAQP
jgi:predicted nucleic acid-binding protein